MARSVSRQAAWAQAAARRAALVVPVATAFSLAACAPDRPIEPVEGADTVRVVIRETGPLGHRVVEDIADPERVAAFTAFANDRRDGFAVPSGEIAPATLSVSFYARNERIDGFEAGGAGASYFIARGDGAARRVRPLSLENVAELARLSGHDAADIFRP